MIDTAQVRPLHASHKSCRNERYISDEYDPVQLIIQTTTLYVFRVGYPPLGSLLKAGTRRVYEGSPIKHFRTSE
jgi:hypothetical protein